MPAFLCAGLSAGLRSLAALLLAGLAVHAGGSDAAEDAGIADREITGLISAVESSGCVFIRNGDRHDAAEAADHLRLKYRRGKRYADTAEHFIERLASKSSWSGEPYLIECGGTGEPSGDWLTTALLRIRGA
jgi:hypothetical protein